MGWITASYHFVSSLVNCGVEHSSQVVNVALDLAKCMTGKFFQ